MPENTGHLSEWTLDLLAQGEMSRAERGVAEAHLRGCARCADALAEIRALEASLAALPRFAPSVGFADVVLARVAAAAAPAVIATQRPWLSRTARGWVLAGIFTLGPLTTLGMLWGWLLSRPLVSTSSLLILSRQWIGGALTSGVARVAEVIVGSASFRILADAAGRIASASAAEVAAALLLIGAGLPLSGWALARLLRNSDGEITHAH